MLEKKRVLSNLENEMAVFKIELLKNNMVRTRRGEKRIHRPGVGRKHLSIISLPCRQYLFVSSGWTNNKCSKVVVVVVFGVFGMDWNEQQAHSKRLSRKMRLIGVAHIVKRT